MRTFKKKRKQEFSIQPKWPEEISQHCPKCKRKLDIRSDLESGPGPIGRFIRKYSFALIYLNPLCLILLGTTDSLSMKGAAATFATLTFAPTIILNLLVRIMPATIRIYCFRCGHTDYHNPPPSMENHPLTHK